MQILWYILSGALSGLIAGMGMGGGTVLIPALTLLIGVEQHSAQGINMLSFIPTAIAAIIVHKREGRVDFTQCLPIILCGGVAAALCALIATALDGMLLRRMYGIFLAGLCIFQFISGEKKYKCACKKHKKEE